MEKDFSNKRGYVMTDKNGKEIYSSKSFGGFIISTILTILLTGIAIAILGGIVVGIASIFS